jgi:hypothetical protein
VASCTRFPPNSHPSERKVGWHGREPSAVERGSWPDVVCGPLNWWEEALSVPRLGIRGPEDTTWRFYFLVGVERRQGQHDHPRRSVGPGS